MESENLVHEHRFPIGSRHLQPRSRADATRDRGLEDSLYVQSLWPQRALSFDNYLHITCIYEECVCLSLTSSKSICTRGQAFAVIVNSKGFKELSYHPTYLSL